ILVKATSVVLVLPVVIFLIRQRLTWHRAAIEVALGLTGAVLLGGALIMPFWAGRGTFFGVQATAWPLPAWNVTGLATALLHEWRGEAAMAGILVVASCVAARWTRTLAELLVTCAALSVFAFLVLPLEWPWYGSMPAVLLGILQR